MEEKEEGGILVRGIGAAPDLLLKQGTEEGSAASVLRSCSCGNGYGCTTVDHDEKTDHDAEKGQHPRKQFAVRFGGDSDPIDPRSFSKINKWVILAIVSADSTCLTCASYMYTLAYSQIITEFHISRAVALLGPSLY